MNADEKNFIEDVQSHALDVLDETFNAVEGEGSESQGIEKDLETYKAACHMLAERVALHETQFDLELYPAQQLSWQEYLELKNEH